MQILLLPEPGDHDAAAPCKQEPAIYKQAWKRIGASSLPRAHRATAWRIMHGALACNAFVLSRHTSQGDISRAYCTAPACKSARCFETLTHLFISCPSVSPALQWLLSVWHAISGVQLQPTAALILGDDPAAWAPHAEPGAAIYALWTRLRLTYLHTVWMARANLSLLQPDAHAAAIAAAVVADLTYRMHGDWLRVGRDIRSATSTCSSWYKGFNPELTAEAFAGRWAHGDVLCSIPADEAEDLQVHLSLTHPVAAPVAAPAAMDI
jgi:hypothetical protein